MQAGDSKQDYLHLFFECLVKLNLEVFGAGGAVWVSTTRHAEASPPIRSSTRPLDGTTTRPAVSQGVCAQEC